MSDIRVIKRDGSIEEFDVDKLSNSIMMAAMDTGGENIDTADEIASNVVGIIEDNQISEIETKDIQLMTEKELIDNGHLNTAMEYKIKADERSRLRDMNSSLMQLYEEIAFSKEEDSDTKRENANVNSSTAMGTMLKYGSEGAKRFNIEFVLDEEQARAHTDGDIHIHDLDFLTLTETCCQIPLDELFRGGFNTGHGFLREPRDIRSAAALTSIAIQANQNEQHGGQSIPLLDYYLAPYVSRTYIRKMIDIIEDRHIECRKIKSIIEDLKKCTNEYMNKRSRCIQDPDWAEYHTIFDTRSKRETNRLFRQAFNRAGMKLTDSELRLCRKLAMNKTEKEVYQAMEALISNLNTMHSRAGAQVPFSSINYGTDTSIEGRMIIRALLENTYEGLGYGETSIFPIQIFKLKNGISRNKGDANYDLREYAELVSAKRLYPNFSNLDAPYNKAIYVEGRPETEVAYMGCRTRVATNMHDKSKEIIPGRGNLSFTSINLPRIAIRSKGNVDVFFKNLDRMLELVHRQLKDRFEIQCMKHPINYPFLMGQGIWLGTEQLGPMNDIREALKHGTLTVGFIGLAETLVALIGKHHGESDEAQELGLEIIRHMREYTDAWSKEENMNYSLIATPAEGLSGRFVKLDRKLFGVIPGVTDKEYYTNSSHIPVGYKISAFDKIDKEAPYHEIENGGHILYIEMDGDPSKNVKAFHKIVDYMCEKGAGYFAINHPVDRDPICGYVGIIGDKCPRCGREEGKPMSMEMWNKLNKYANVGNASILGACGNIYEENDRVPNIVKNRANKEA